MIPLVYLTFHMKYYISVIYWDINMEMAMLNNTLNSFKSVVGIMISYEEN